jgi:hypothetical protein
MLPVVTTQLASVQANAGNTLNYASTVTVNPANGSLGGISATSPVPTVNQYASPGKVTTSSISANLPMYALLFALAWFATRSF